MSRPEDQLSAARQCWERGELSEAAALFRGVAACADPGVVPEASHLLACVLEGQGDLEGARAAHRSVIESGHPVFGQRSALALGLLLVSSREWAAAHRALTAAAEGADPETTALADTCLMLVCSRLGDMEAARAALKRAQQCDSPRIAELIADMDLEDLVVELGGAVHLESLRHGDPQQRMCQGEQLLEQGSEQAAEEIFRQLLTCGDRAVVSRAAFRLYPLYAGREEYAAAREVAEHAIAAGDPDDVAMAQHLLAGALVDLGEYREALNAQRLAAADPRPGIRLPALIEEAKITGNSLGDMDAAKAIFRRVIASGDAEYAATAHACLGQIHTEAGEVAEAVAEWRAVLDSGQAEHAPAAVAFLARLLNEAKDGSPIRAAVLATIEAACGHGDKNTAFMARAVRDAEVLRAPLTEPAAEQALQDADQALERLRAGDLTSARAMLRRAADSGDGPLAGRAAVMLALVEIGENDLDQAEELLTYGAGLAAEVGAAAAVYLQVLRSPAGAGHDLLQATVAHQRHGRDAGLARYHAAAGGADPSAAALAKVALAQLYASIGLDRSAAVKLLHDAADSGDRLALSFAAVYFKVLFSGSDRDEAVTLLRRAHADGHPVLAPWVSFALGTLLADGGETELPEARSAFEAVAATAHAGLLPEAEKSLMGVLERQGDLVAVCALHERTISRGDPVQAARSAWLLGFALLRLGDLDAARAAFDRMPGGDPENAHTGGFARSLLARDFDAAAVELARLRELGDSDVRYWMSLKAAVIAASEWQRSGDTAATRGALSLVVTYGLPARAQEAAALLGALENDAGNKEAAIAAWQQAATGDDKELAATALHGLGSARRDLGDTDGSVAAFRQAMELFGGEGDEHDECVMRLGEVLAQGGRIEAAREALAQVSTWSAGLSLGAALYEAGNLEAAAAEFRTAATEATDADQSAAAAFNLARVLDDLGDVDGAAGAARQAVAAGSQQVGAQAWHNLGDYLSKLGDLTGAREAFENAAAADPDVAAAAMFTLGERLEEAGDAAGARVAFEHAAQGGTQPDAIRSRGKLGTATPDERALLLTVQGDRDAALTILTEIHTSRAVAELRLALGEVDLTAVRQLLPRLASDPQHQPAAGGLMLDAAVRYADEEDTTTARTLLDLAIGLGDPATAAKAKGNLAVIEAQAGNTARAEWISLQVAACGLAEPAGVAWNNIGAWRQARGDISGAIEAGWKALDSGYPLAVVQTAKDLAGMLEARGDAAGARKALTAGAAADHPRALSCLRDLLYLLGRLEDEDGLREVAEQAVASGDPETVATAFVLRGEARLARQDPAAAEELFREAVRAGHPAVTAATRMDLAQLLRDRGDTAAARKEVELAVGLGIFPASAAAGNHLAAWLAEDGDLAAAAEVFAQAAACAAAAADPGLEGLRDEWAQASRRNIIAMAAQAYEAGDDDTATATLHLAAQAGAAVEAVEAARLIAGSCTGNGAQGLATARRYYQTAITLDPGDGPLIELDLAEMLADHGAAGEAREIYERLSGHSDALVRTGARTRHISLLTQQGNDQAALALTEQAAADSDGRFLSLFGSLLGTMQSEQGDAGEALRTLRAAAADGEPVALITLAQTLVKSGELAEGREVYQRAAATQDPDMSSRAWVGLGRTFHDDDEERARECYLNAVDAPDRHTAAVAAMMLGALAKGHRDFAAALPWYQRVIDSGDSEAPLAAGHLGELCYWLGDRDGAVRFYELTLATTDRSDLIGEAAFRLGEISHRDGDIKAARELLDRAASADDDDFSPQARELLSQLGCD